MFQSTTANNKSQKNFFGSPSTQEEEEKASQSQKIFRTGFDGSAPIDFVSEVTQCQAAPNVDELQMKDKEDEIQRKPNRTGLPERLKAGVEDLSGLSMDDVKVHYNSHKPSQLGALAYAQGSDIHVASGQEQHLPHEAWHVAQQKQGKVKAVRQMKDNVYVNDDISLENEADKIGVKAITQLKNDSARFDGDNELKGIGAGLETVKQNDTGLKVVKLQQALIDMGYKLPKYGVDGKYGDETKAAVIEFQKNSKLAQTGEFDSDTFNELNKRFDTRSDYIKSAENFDSKNPSSGTRALTFDQKKAALESLKPQPQTPGATFDKKDAAAYSTEIKNYLDLLIPKLHTELYASKKALRSDPAKNFHKDNNLEGAANAGKDVTDNLYGALNQGPVFKMGANLIDQWSDEETRNKGLSDIDKKEKAKGKVIYLVNANCAHINSKFNAVPSETEESTALSPVIESFIDTPDKIQIMLDIETGWEGAQLQGIQYLQLFKDPNAEKNRLRLWELFHVSIHEYIHTLAASKYLSWASKLGGSQEHTLVEGFCDFFTLNVRKKNPESTLVKYKKKVEGDFYDSSADVPDTGKLGIGVYSSNEEAERMVGIIGIANAQLGYFQGRTDLMGK